MTALTVLLAVTGVCSRAEAQNYPWCAAYSDGMGGAENCGFISFEQCQQTTRGMGGFCEVNTQYQPPPSAAPHPPHPIRRSDHPSP
jgi:hypothetical protein